MYKELIDSVHNAADNANIKWDDDPIFMLISKGLTGEERLDDMDSDQLSQVLDEIENNPGPFSKKAHFAPVPFKLKGKNEKNKPEFEHFRTNYDYTGENYLDKVERRLKRLSKTLKKEKHKQEAKELDKMIKSVKPKKKK